MKIETFKTREEDGKLYVLVRVPHSWAAGGIPKIRLDTKDIKKLLEEKNIKHGKCLTPDRSLINWREPTRKVEWIFEIPLDKLPEPVILKEEKSVQPKPTRKKRTRSSTKKVSTEE